MTDILEWEKDSYFIVISSGQELIIREMQEQLLNYGLLEDSDFCIFNKFITARKGVYDTKDYFFGYSRNYEIKESGFKVFTYSKGKRAKKRIVVLGGSTSDCGYNTTIRNWTEWLAIILRDKGYDAEIWSGGIQGYASSQELLKLIRDGLLLKPDLVISFSGINDATGIGVIKGHPMIMRNIKYLLKEEENEVEYGLYNHEQPSSIWLTNMKLMKSICEAFDISFLGVLEPFPFYDTRNKLDAFANIFFEEDVQYRIFRFYDEVKKRMVEEKNLIDLSNLLVDRSDMVYDYIHCDERGNRLIAESIEKYISIFEKKRSGL